MTALAESTAGILVDEAGAEAPRYEFDAAFQQKIAALLLRDTQFAQLTEGLIKPEFFENRAVAGVVAVTLRYIARYRKAPGDKVTVASILKDAALEKLLPIELLKAAAGMVGPLYDTDVSDRDYVADQCATFARHQAVSQAILDSVELVEKRNFDAVGTMLRKALDTGVQVHGGAYDYAEMIASRTKDRKDRAAGVRPPTGISTGFAAIDEYLYHRGWGRRELSLLMGGPKSGKSMAMIAFSVAAIALGYKVLYVTLEVAADIIAQRIDANVSECVMMDMHLRPHEVEAKVQEFMAKAAPLKIHEFPSGQMRVSDLRRLIEHYKAQGTVFDLVVVDYADLMAPERVTESATENSKSVYVNLRGLAMMEGFALLSATQTNRSGATKAVATMTDVAEDFNKIRIADVVISINVSEEERALKQCRLHFAACRNQRAGFTIRIEQDTDRGKFITKVIGED